VQKAWYCGNHFINLEIIYRGPALSAAASLYNFFSFSLSLSLVCGDAVACAGRAAMQGFLSCLGLGLLAGRWREQRAWPAAGGGEVRCVEAKAAEKPTEKKKGRKKGSLVLGCFDGLDGERKCGMNNLLRVSPKNVL